MQLIAPDLLETARGLSPAVTGVGAAAGLALWSLGWKWHRFWIVLALTAAGGVAGLAAGESGPAVLATGLLLAVGAGMLALELAKVLTFTAAGGAAFLAFRAVVPEGGEPTIAFLAGGLLGVLLFRFWVMLLSGLGGALVGGHCVLLLVERFAKGFDAAAWAAKNAVALNIAVGVLAVSAVVTQSLLDRWLAGAEYRRKQRVLAGLSNEEREHLKKLKQQQQQAKAAKSWLPWAVIGGGGSSDKDKKRKAA